MFGKIFAPYGKVWTILNTITDVMGLSLLWLACSLPLITIGAATAALYDAAVRGIRFRQETVYRRFLNTFRQELKTGIGISLLWGLILVFCSFVLFLLDSAAEENSTAWFMAGAYRVMMLIPLGVGCWSCAITSRFTMSFRQLTGTALSFWPAHLPSSILISLLTWACLWAIENYFLPIFFLPACCVIGWSFAAERIFAQYGGEIKPESEESDLPSTDA